jgi:hypothetical protein
MSSDHEYMERTASKLENLISESRTKVSIQQGPENMLHHQRLSNVQPSKSVTGSCKASQTCSNPTSQKKVEWECILPPCLPLPPFRSPPRLRPPAAAAMRPPSAAPAASRAAAPAAPTASSACPSAPSTPGPPAQPTPSRPPRAAGCSRASSARLSTWPALPWPTG